MKYKGSKLRISKYILPIILKNRKINQWYVEPFAGGMNSICEVEGNRIANDKHYYLIEMWKSLLGGWVPEDYYDKEFYKKVMNNKNDYPAYLVGYMGYNCSYCGDWDRGFSGKLYENGILVRNYQDEAKRNIMKQLPKLKGVTLYNSDYKELEIPDKSIIYFDPPYAGTDKYLHDIEYDEFWSYVRKKHTEGHTVFVSEYNAPADFECVFEKQLSSSIGANGVTISKEKLFTLK